jgi:hypothetical protein
MLARSPDFPAARPTLPAQQPKSAPQRRSEATVAPAAHLIGRFGSITYALAMSDSPIVTHSEHSNDTTAILHSKASAIVVSSARSSLCMECRQTLQKLFGCT